MKKTLLSSLLLALGLTGAGATQFWYDTLTNYPGGCLTTNTANWYPHLPGGLTANDLVIVTNSYTSGAATSGKRLRVNGLNSEYAMRLFDTNYPASTNVLYSGVVYASFIVNANFVPSAGQGTYFACFNSADTNNPPLSVTNGFDFRGRVFQIGNTNAYPFTNTVAGTYRFGVANAAGDPAQGGSRFIQYVPIDLIKNVDYQVVLKFVIDDGNPFDAGTSTLWINPASESDTPTMVVADGSNGDVGSANNGLAGLLFRQRTGGGTVDIRDVVVGDSFADVVTNLSAGPVLVATNFNTVTNYAGNPALLEAFATCPGGGALSYQWYHVASGVTNAVPGGTTQALLLTSLSGADTGNYFCAVTNEGGLGALSKTNFYIAVNATPTAPGFTTQPAGSTAPLGGSLTLSCAAYGTGPLSYQWYYNGNPITDGANPFGYANDASMAAGAQTPTLVISGLSTNETGNYSVTVTGGAGSPATSTTVHITVNLPQPVNVGFIRSLENAGNNWQETNTGDLFTLTGVVTTYTNVTSGATSSYFIQDATGGINLFVTGDPSFRPQMGDIVTATGTLSMFNNDIELYVNQSANPYSTYAVVDRTNQVPTPVVFGPWSLTNNAGIMETNIEGRLVMLTNVFFTGAIPLNTKSGGNFTVTNSQGMAFTLNLSAQDLDVCNQTINSRFAWTITGVVVQNKSGSAWASSGYQLYVTRFGDIVTNAPAPVAVSASRTGNQVSLNWTAVPYVIGTPGAYAYSVYAASDVAGPYLPLATGLTFNTTAGSYTETLAPGTTRFYKVSCP